MPSSAKTLLRDYKAKRNFGHTPEPSGEVRASRRGELRFVIQKHRASHLHYDFRLEADGVLKSWAVPKGPSLNPTDRRLAMQVEDHPLDYYDFEGVIPAGNYGAGEVIVWDAGTYELLEGKKPSEEIARGKLKIQLYGKKLKGGFALVKMHGRATSDNAWLLIKEKDEGVDLRWHADRDAKSVKTGRTLDEIKADPNARTWQSKQKTSSSAKIPVVRHPMLATLIDKSFDDENWLFEIKWDGVRALVTKDEKGRLSIVSRNGLDLLEQFPELARLGGCFRGRNLVVDGEIVALDKEGRSSFQLLQSRLNRASPTDQLIARVPVVFVAFDLLYASGCDLRNEPLESRKKTLEEIIIPGGRVMYSKHVVGTGKELFALAMRSGLEGIIGKRRASLYRESRTRDWVKIKTQLRQECVIAGWTDPKGARSDFGSLLLGVYENKRLVYIGHVGTGFDGRLLTTIKKELDTLKTTTSPFTSIPRRYAKSHWVKPKLVAEVKFSEWTNDGFMRHPVFLGLRKDKSPRECVREVPARPKEVA